MISGNVKGHAELRQVQAQLIVAMPELIRKSTPGVRREMREIEPQVKAEAAATLPKRGGYAVIMSRSAKARTSVRATSMRIVARADISARGKREDRDVSRVNKGQLRHPSIGTVRGPRFRWVWRTTAVRPGFVTRVIDRAEGRITDVVRRARDEVANDIVRG